MARTVTLSLASHTNVGKTTLARTLLRRDVGEVRDEAHVTLEAEPHTLLESAEGDRLILWDTPGFGDSQRLARRIERAGNPIGWFLNEVWDRWRDRAWWSSQRAVRNVLDHADAVLYLVDAGQDPADALPFVEPELRVLALLRKPVLVLLNQTGPLRAADVEAAELERWRAPLAGRDGVHGVLALDAFTRCWVQEGTLLRAVAAALPADGAAAVQRLHAAWAARQRQVWADTMQRLAARLARAATDVEPVAEAGWDDRLRQVGRSIGIGRDGADTPQAAAMQALARRSAQDDRDCLSAVLRLHGLDGAAAEAARAWLIDNFQVREPLSEGKGALLGGVVAGALTGLKADVASGGLTMGGGMLVGGLLGALGGAGLVRGYNAARGREVASVAWTDAELDAFTHQALLAYAAIAHHGRGRGAWSHGELPAVLRAAVDTVFAERRVALPPLWARRGDATGAALESALADFLKDASQALLLRLYPDAADAFADPPPAPTSSACVSR